MLIRFCFVVWLLFSVSSMFSMTSFGDCIRPQQQETTQKIQNILNEVYRIPQPPSTPEWMISWFTTKLLSFIAFTMSSRLLTSVAKRSFLLGCVFFFCFFVLHTHCHTRHSHLLHNDFKITKELHVIGCVLL